MDRFNNVSIENRSYGNINALQINVQILTPSLAVGKCYTLSLLYMLTKNIGLDNWCSLKCELSKCFYMSYGRGRTEPPPPNTKKWVHKNSIF